MAYQKIDYNKEPLSIEQQIYLLKERGLIINNTNYAIDILSQINYYRLSAYIRLFQELDTTTKKHIFVENTKFESIIELYNYDRFLRKELLSILLDIEVYIKTIFTYTLSVEIDENNKDPFILYKKDKLIFNDDKGKNYKIYTYLLNELKNSCSSPKEIFIKHYKNKYKEAPEKLPIWLAVEIMTMGNIENFYSIINKEYQKLISKKLNIKDPSIFVSWLSTIRYLRNRVAHNYRVFNSRSKYTPSLYIIKKSLSKNIDNYTEVLESIKDTKFIYSSIVMLEYFVYKSKLDDRNIKNIYSIINDISNKYPNIKSSMGIHKDIKIIKPLYFK